MRLAFGRSGTGRSRLHERRAIVSSSMCSTFTATLTATDFGVDRTACHHPQGSVTALPGTITIFTHDDEWAGSSPKGPKPQSHQDFRASVASSKMCAGQPGSDRVGGWTSSSFVPLSWTSVESHTPRWHCVVAMLSPSVMMFATSPASWCSLRQVPPQRASCACPFAGCARPSARSPRYPTVDASCTRRRAS